MHGAKSSGMPPPVPRPVNTNPDPKDKAWLPSNQKAAASNEPPKNNAWEQI